MNVTIALLNHFIRNEKVMFRIRTKSIVTEYSVCADRMAEATISRLHNKPYFRSIKNCIEGKSFINFQTNTIECFSAAVAIDTEYLIYTRYESEKLN